MFAGGGVYGAHAPQCLLSLNEVGHAPRDLKDIYSFCWPWFVVANNLVVLLTIIIIPCILERKRMSSEEQM